MAELEKQTILKKHKVDELPLSAYRKVYLINNIIIPFFFSNYQMCAFRFIMEQVT